ncbi:MAG: FISUMP domain-containing protein [Lewinella sp.]
MKRLIASLILLITLLIGWYFFVPESWLAPIVEPEQKAPVPELVIPEELFSPGPDVRDEKGNLIPTTIVGGNTWTTVNATVTDCPGLRFADGSEVGPNVEFYDTSARYGYYQNDASKGYGVVYTHKAVRDCKLCPEGFQVPTKADWDALFAALGTAADRGNLLRRKYGSPFAAGLGGRVDSYGSNYAGSIEFWWALDEAEVPGDRNAAWCPELKLKGELRMRPQDKKTANYVRCVKR